jgi:hypothetical protein
MNTLDAGAVLLTCGDHHGSRALAALPTVILPSCPGRAELDPVLRELTARRLVVAGTDADLAAVLGRLLRRERLDVEVAYVPRGRSAAAGAWGLPRDTSALALDGVAAPVPLVRDDAGGVLVGRAEARLRGEVYCDETLVLRGAGQVVVQAGPDGIAVRASRTGRAPDGRTRAVPPRAPAGGAPPSGGPCSSAGSRSRPCWTGCRTRAPSPGGPGTGTRPTGCWSAPDRR